MQCYTSWSDEMKGLQQYEIDDGEGFITQCMKSTYSHSVRCNATSETIAVGSRCRSSSSAFPSEPQTTKSRRME